jgi:hypothetical protein
MRIELLNKSSIKDILIVVFIFLLSLSIRITYQYESKALDLIRSDAGQYYLFSHNLYYSGIYSPSILDENTSSEHVFTRKPGYPLFLYVFHFFNKRLDEFVASVTKVQAIIGSLTAVLTYLMARLFISRIWLAALAGLFTCLNPHLIAIEHYLLTETVFAFTVMLSALLIILSWSRRSIYLSFIAGILSGYALLVHNVIILYFPLLSLSYIFIKRLYPKMTRTNVITQLMCLLLGVALIYSPYVFIKQINKSKNAQDLSAQTSDYLLKHKDYLLYIGLILGADINLKNNVSLKHSPYIQSLAKEMKYNKRYMASVLSNIIRKDPLAYMKWYFIGKHLYAWKWDNYYNGDVYQYPMVRKGFDVNLFLYSIHALMKLLHWPLYALALVPFLLLITWRYRSFVTNNFLIIVPMLFFVNTYIVLFMLAPLPRYTIFLRPLSYVLAAYTLNEIYSYLMRSPILKRQKLLS